MECQACRAPLKNDDAQASMAGRVMGDRVFDRFYRCSDCDAYSLRSFRDSFTGGESAVWHGPFSEAEARDRIAKMTACKNPSDDRCRCGAHRSYFGKALD